jgi:3-oxoacyl-[acyl-carrier-protein] synthase III
MTEKADVFVSGVGLALPPPMPAAEAVELGLTDEWTIQRTRIRSVCVSEESGPELAARAARQALRAAGAGPAEIGLVLHACTYFQGHDLWAPASYVQRESVGNTCLSLVVEQLSNGGMAAIELAVAYLRADPRRHSALLTTGDRFCLPGMDRWATDPGTVLGDGGTALVLSRDDGFARLCSLATVSDPGLELMGRGIMPFGAAPLTARVPVSVADDRAWLAREIGMSELTDRLLVGQREACKQALDEAGVTMENIDWFVVPNLGYPKMKFQFFSPLGIDPDQTTWHWGSGVGHLGAGDQFAGLAHLARAGALAPGQHCALVSAGGGFAWTVAVLEILRSPSGWS